MNNKNYYPAGTYFSPYAPWNEEPELTEEEAEELMRREEYRQAQRDEYFDMMREERLITRGV